MTETTPTTNNPGNCEEKNIFGILITILMFQQLTIAISNSEKLYILGVATNKQKMSLPLFQTHATITIMQFFQEALPSVKFTFKLFAS